MLAATTRRLAGREVHEQKEWSSEVDGQLYAQDCRLRAKGWVVMSMKKVFAERSNISVSGTVFMG